MKIKQLGKDLTTKTIGLPAWLFVTMGIGVLIMQILNFFQQYTETGIYDWGILWSGFVFFCLLGIMWPYLIIHQDKTQTQQRKTSKGDK